MITPFLALATLAVNSISQNATNRAVTVSYTLGGDEPAVVTLDGVTTNGAAMANRDLRILFGDVNRMLATGTHAFVWQPPASCGFSAETVQVALKAWATNAPPDYMVIDLTAAARPVAYYSSAEMIPGGVTSRRYATDALVMRRIPAAGVTWRMGSPVGEASRQSDEMTHYVKLSQDFYLAIYPTTIRQYYWLYGSSPIDGYVGSTPSNAKLSTYGAYDWDAPVTGYSYAGLRGNLHKTSCTLTGDALNSPFKSWPDDGHELSAWGVTCTTCGAISNALLQKFRENWPGFLFDIPSEAEWEFACRGGSDTYEARPGNPDSVDEIAVYAANSTNELASVRTCVPRPVGMKKPNGYGLYDMLGNISEWTRDFYGTYPNDAEIHEDPTGPSYTKIRNDTTHMRVLRGGSYYTGASYLRTARRASMNMYFTQVNPYSGERKNTILFNQSSGMRLWLPCHAVR